MHLHFIEMAQLCLEDTFISSQSERCRSSAVSGSVVDSLGFWFQLRNGPFQQQYGMSNEGEALTRALNATHYLVANSSM